MRALLFREVEDVRGRMPPEPQASPSLDPECLRGLGERLRRAYETSDPLPVRLAELVDRLGRRERKEV